MSTQPFKVQVPQTTLDDLQQRLTRTHWPDEIQGANWEYGTNRYWAVRLVRMVPMTSCLLPLLGIGCYSTERWRSTRPTTDWCPRQ